MDAIEKTNNSIDFGHLTCHDIGPTSNVNCNNLIDAAILLDDIKPSRTKLDEKVQVDFKSKLSEIRIERIKSDK